MKRTYGMDDYCADPNRAAVTAWVKQHQASLTIWVGEQHPGVFHVLEADLRPGVIYKHQRIVFRPRRIVTEHPFPFPRPDRQEAA